MATFPVPVTAYGLSFSRDGKYLAVGSFETGEILRINLAEGRIDRRVKAATNIHKFFTTARGDKFLVFSGHSTRRPKPIQVRRWSDLKLVQTLSIRSLFPELDSLEPSYLRMTADGRHLVVATPDKDGYALKKGMVVFEVKER